MCAMLWERWEKRTECVTVSRVSSGDWGEKKTDRIDVS